MTEGWHGWHAGQTVRIKDPRLPADLNDAELGPLRSPSGSRDGHTGSVRFSPMASSKGLGLDILSGVATLMIIVLVAMATGFVVLMIRYLIYWLRR